VVEVVHCHVGLVNAHVRQIPQAFTKGNIHSFITCLSYKGYERCYMSFVQVVTMKPIYQKENGHDNLVLTPWVAFEVTSYQATC
jgi:hypothetical protein